MERLTQKDKNGHVYVIGCPSFDVPKEANKLIQTVADKCYAIENILGDDYDLNRLREALEKQAEYEQFMEKWKQAVKIAGSVKQLGAERVAELVEADRDGRCVVLPKDGMVYYIEEVGGKKWIGNKPIKQITVKCGWGIASIEFSLFDAGKYFTREAAEAALKGDQDGKDL